MTSEEKAAIRARCEAATRGPWMYGEDGGPGSLCHQEDADVGVFATGCTIMLGDISRADDATFIASARTDVPALLDALEAAEAAAVQLREEFDSAMATVDQGILTARQLNEKIAALQTMNDKWQAGVAELQAEIARLRRVLQMHHDKAAGDYWAWQGDGHDNLETLVCPVLIRPESLLALQAKLARFEQAQEIQMRRGWWVVPYGDKWRVSLPDHDHSIEESNWPDPTTAILEAEKWLQQQ